MASMEAKINNNYVHTHKPFTEKISISAIVCMFMDAKKDVLHSKYDEPERIAVVSPLYPFVSQEDATLIPKHILIKFIS